jgi:diguanylate cyclase (GGDEF)-like protein/PAS domain S-box-containing protein
MLRINQLQKRHIFFGLPLFFILWGVLAWNFANHRFMRDADALIGREQLHAQDIAQDVADSFRRNLHLVAGVPATFQSGLRFVNAVSEFKTNVPSRLSKDTLIKRWGAVPSLRDLNRQLELTQGKLGVDLLYVVNAAGDSIASSNWNKPTSTVGTNFADRQWFTAVRGGRHDMQYAMGRITHIPGLFFASPIMINGQFKGAIIAKVDLPSLSFLTRQADIYVTDTNGVIILAHDPAMYMMAVPGATIDQLSTKQKSELYLKTDFNKLEINKWEELPDQRLNHLMHKSFPHVLGSTVLPEYGLTVYSESELTALPHLLRERQSNYILIWLLGSVAALIVAALLIYLREMRESAKRIENSEDRLRLLLSSVSNGIWGLDKDGNTTFVNLAAANMLGYSPEELVGKPMHLTIHYAYADGSHYPKSKCPMHATLVDGQSRLGVDEVLWRKDGSNFPVDYSSHPLMRQGQLEGAVVVFEDISERKQKDEALKLTSLVYQVSNDGVVVTDENNLILDVNPAFTEITGYTLEEVRGRNPRLFQSGKHDAEFYKIMWRAIVNEGHWQGEVWDLRKDGELHAKWLSISVIRHTDGSVFRYVGQFSDITEKKRKDELIWEQANFDTLTNLPNRRLFSDRFRQAISSSARSGRHCAMLSLDLDQFKRLNDTFGHSMGDKLLIEVANRLILCVRDEDTVARMGGDEFMIILNGLSSTQNEAVIQAELIAEKIRSELCRPYLINNSDYHCSTSIGIVLFLGHGDTQEKLLAHVDTAMYQAKSKGRNTICFFDAGMQDILDKRVQLESALRGAQQRGELSLHYQLQMHSTGRPLGVEALLRWSHPELGMISPVHFIPVAEESGLILPIGLWVLETACQQLAHWQTSPLFCNLSIAINVSSLQFREAAFTDCVRNALEQSGIKPALLKLELTESLVLDDVEDSIRKMNELKDLGIKFSMDDFGTGYSSLSYLSRLPIDQLKIDQSFVRDITTDQHDAAIVQTIISMALSLGMEVIAEGVETQEQRDFLELRGCQAYQGYLYAKPVPIDLLENNLEQMAAS